MLNQPVPFGANGQAQDQDWETVKLSVPHGTVLVTACENTRLQGAHRHTPPGAATHCTSEDGWQTQSSLLPLPPGGGVYMA